MVTDVMPYVDRKSFKYPSSTNKIKKIETDKKAKNDLKDKYK